MLANGGHVSGSPFAVDVVRGVELSFTARQGCAAPHRDGGGLAGVLNPHDAGLVVTSMSSVIVTGDFSRISHPRRFV